jgi:hypothetical protein
MPNTIRTGQFGFGVIKTFKTCCLAKRPPQLLRRLWLCTTPHFRCEIYVARLICFGKLCLPLVDCRRASLPTCRYLILEQYGGV